MSFTMETELNDKISFSAVNVIHEQGIFKTDVYLKSTFSGVYTDFDSFLHLPNWFDLHISK